jgi:hypothetical protein
MPKVKPQKPRITIRGTRRRVVVTFDRLSPAAHEMIAARVTNMAELLMDNGWKASGKIPVAR